jgi:hypothetical protein
MGLVALLLIKKLETIANGRIKNIDTMSSDCEYLCIKQHVRCELKIKKATER